MTGLLGPDRCGATPEPHLGDPFCVTLTFANKSVAFVCKFNTGTPQTSESRIPTHGRYTTPSTWVASCWMDFSVGVLLRGDLYSTVHTYIPTAPPVVYLFIFLLSTPPQANEALKHELSEAETFINRE